VHELGHCICALFFNWEIDKISIYPYGGFSKFNEDLNRPIKEEFLILLSGPLVQIIFFILCSLVGLRDTTFSLLKTYHYAILCFNLLPIYPLDGGKLVNLFLSKYYSYYKSLKFSLILSYFLITLIFIFQINYFFSLNIIMMLLLLLQKVIIHWRRKDMYHYKFLLERYLNNYKFSKVKLINNTKEMMRDKKHVFKKGNHYYSEMEILSKKFKRKY